MPTLLLSARFRCGTAPLICLARRASGIAALAGGALMLAACPGLAQVESFILKPGSNVGPASKVKATNCVTAPDGSVTCDTKIENNPADTPAKPQFSPFRN